MLKQRVRRSVVIGIGALALAAGAFGHGAPAMAGDVCASGSVNGTGAGKCVTVTAGGNDCGGGTTTLAGNTVVVGFCNPNDVP